MKRRKIIGWEAGATPHFTVAKLSCGHFINMSSSDKLRNSKNGVVVIKSMTCSWCSFGGKILK